MSKNTTAIARGATLAKQTLTQQAKAAQLVGKVKVDKPNRAQRRAAAKQDGKQ